MQQILILFLYPFINKTISLLDVNSPGEINIAELSHFSVEETPGAPGEPSSMDQGPSHTSRGVSEFGVNETGHSQCK